MFLYADQSSPPARHSKIKGFLVEKMKGVFHTFPATLYYLIFFQRCICPERTCPRFYWLTICCCAPKEVEKKYFVHWTDVFLWYLRTTPDLTVLLFFLYWFLFLSGGKCHSYQWRTGGWSNNERAVWCQRSDGVNVTGEESHVITWDRLQQH